MGLILDTSVVIAAEKQQFDLSGLINAYGTGNIAIPSIVAAEFLHGWERAPPGHRKDARLEFFDELVLSVPVVPFEFDDARIHARLMADLAGLGFVVGAHDLIIAATCLHLDWELATLNQAEFSRVPGLRLVPTDSYRLGK